MLNRGISRLLILATFLACATGIFFLACGDYESEQNDNEGGGTTGDIGEYCYFTCTEGWCIKKSFPECLGEICIGRQGDLYCTSYCLNQKECPDGFTCSTGCDMGTADDFCVSDSDWEFLKSAGICS